MKERCFGIIFTRSGNEFDYSWFACTAISGSVESMEKRDRWAQRTGQEVWSNSFELRRKKAWFCRKVTSVPGCRSLENRPPKTRRPPDDRSHVSIPPSISFSLFFAVSRLNILFLPWPKARKYFGCRWFATSKIRGTLYLVFFNYDCCYCLVFQFAICNEITERDKSPRRTNWHWQSHPALPSTQQSPLSLLLSFPLTSYLALSLSLSLVTLNTRHSHVLPPHSRTSRFYLPLTLFFSHTLPPSLFEFLYRPALRTSVYAVSSIFFCTFVLTGVIHSPLYMLAHFPYSSRI